MIRIIDLLVFFIAYMIILGVWQFISLAIHKKGYELEKLEDESFFDFMCRYYSDDFFWKLRRKYGIKWVYNSKVYSKFIMLKGFILIVLAILLVLAILWLKSTEYYIWLSIEL